MYLTVDSMAMLVLPQGDHGIDAVNSHRPHHAPIDVLTVMHWVVNHTMTPTAGVGCLPRMPPCGMGATS